jgi:hypothetical protein
MPDEPISRLRQRIIEASRQAENQDRASDEKSDALDKDSAYDWKPPLVAHPADPSGGPKYYRVIKSLQ